MITIWSEGKRVALVTVAEYLEYSIDELVAMYS